MALLTHKLSNKFQTPRLDHKIKSLLFLWTLIYIHTYTRDSDHYIKKSFLSCDMIYSIFMYYYYTYLPQRCSVMDFFHQGQIPFLGWEGEYFYQAQNRSRRQRCPTPEKNHPGQKYTISNFIRGLFSEGAYAPHGLTHLWSPWLQKPIIGSVFD